MTGPDLDDVLDPEQDKGIPHDRTEHGGMPRVDDELLEQQAQKDRVAAGLEHEPAPPATEQ